MLLVVLLMGRGVEEEWAWAGELGSVAVVRPFVCLALLATSASGLHSLRTVPGLPSSRASCGPGEWAMIAAGLPVAGSVGRFAWAIQHRPMTVLGSFPSSRMVSRGGCLGLCGSCSW